MRLSQTEMDRVLIYSVAQMARGRRDRGLKLNHPEAAALITDEMYERARDGWDYERVRAHGQGLLTAEDVLPGVPTLLRGLACEPVFDDGPRIIVLAEPVRETAADPPGRTAFAAEPVTLNAGRPTLTVTVTNGSDHVVNVSSHYHFYEVNARMEFDRPPTYGHHLDIQAGRSVIWAPGETRQVTLVPFAGGRVADGFQMRDAPGAV